MPPRFWVLRPAKSRPAGVDPEKIVVRHIKCPVNPAHNGTRGLKSGLSIVLPSKHVGDFVWTWFSQVLIGDRARAFLREHRFTGYRLKQAGARFRKAEYGLPPPLRELKVTGWAGMAAPESGVELVDACKVCGMLEYRISDCSRLISPRRWDGADIFMVWPMPLFIFLSDRAGTLLRSAKFTGISVLPAEEIRLDLRGTFSPGRLSNHMPHSRAKILGAKLGIV